MKGDGCGSCREGRGPSIEFTMAFQPIVDVVEGRVWGYEALVRGPAGEPAAHVLNGIAPADIYRFDQACRVRAIELAGPLLPPHDGTKLSINFMPGAVYEPSACIRSSLAAARRVGLDPRRLMFEFTENERMADTRHVERIVAEYRRLGFTTALDDFGAGYAGLNLLANFRPDVIKVDMALVRGIDTSPARQTIMAGLIGIARGLEVEVVAEGVETCAEAGILRAAGIRLMQGYLFARPRIEALPPLEAARELVTLRDAA